MKPSCHSSRQCITLERKVNRCSKKRSITSLKGKCFMFMATLLVLFITRNLEVD